MIHKRERSDGLRSFSEDWENLELNEVGTDWTEIIMFKDGDSDVIWFQYDGYTCREVSKAWVWGINNERFHYNIIHMVDYSGLYVKELARIAQGEDTEIKQMRLF